MSRHVESIKSAMKQLGRTYRTTDEFIGLRFGRLTVLSFLGYGTTKGNRRFLCKCDCGRECETWNTRFYDPDPCCQACKNEQTGRFGQSKSRLRYFWTNAKQSVPEWKDFRVFLADVGAAPSKDMTITAADPKLPVSRTNWQWMNWRQVAAKNRSHKINVLGVVKSKTQWAAICGISKERMRQRLNAMSPEQAVLAYDSAIQYFQEQGMANVEKAWPGSQFTSYFDGQIWRLEKDKDFTCKVSSMRQKLINAATHEGVKVRTRTMGDMLFVQRVDKQKRKVKRVSKSA